MNNGTNVTITTGSSGTNSQLGDININSNILKSAGNDATLNLKAANNIIMAANTSITSTSNKLNLIFNSDFDASGAGAILVNSSTIINTNNGFLTMGGGANPLTTAAIGENTWRDGVRLNGVNISTGAGNINITGKGYSTTAAGGSGINLSAANTISTTTGQINLKGTGGGLGAMSNNYGIFSQGASSTITSSNGNINLVGIGGNDGGTGSTNRGIQFSVATNLSTSNNGAINITGTSANTTGPNNSGAILNGAITTQNGNITIAGTGRGSGSGSDGIELNTVTINSTGSGNININGSGSTISTGSNNYGIYLGSTNTISSTGGNVNLTGTGGGTGLGSSNNMGAILRGLITSQNGDINITGTGGGGGSSNEGIGLTAATIQATGTGNINISGNGSISGTGTSNSGVYSNGIGGVLTNNGNITITGTGGAGTSSNYGINTPAGGGNTETISSTSGNINLTGTGGGAGSGGNDNTGLWLRNGSIQTSGAGTITLNGTGGASSGGNNRGMYFIMNMTSQNGNINLSGNGAGTGGNNIGVYNDSSNVITTGSGNIIVNAVSSNAESTSSNTGLLFHGGGGFYSSSNGSTTVTAASTGGTDIAALSSTNYIGNTTGANTTVNANSISSSYLVIRAGSTSTLTYKPRDTNTAIQVNGSGSGLVLDSALLGTAIAANIVIGRTDSTADINVTGRSWNSNLSLLNGSGDIILTGTNTLSGKALRAVASNGGDITLGTNNAATIFAQTTGTTAGDIILNGLQTASGTGTPLTLVSGHNLINNAGTSALAALSGRWLAYSNNTTDNTLGGLTTNFNRYSCSYGGSCPTLGTGNGLLYSFTPTLTATANAQTTTYGSAAPAYGYTLSGYLGSDAAADTITPSGSLYGSTYSVGNNAGSYDITYTAATLASAMGYGITTYNGLTNGLTVDKKNITAAFNAGLDKTYGDTNPTVDYHNFTFTGIYGSDATSLFTSVTPNFGSVGANTNIGTYSVSAAIGATTNYTVTNMPTTNLVIAKRALTVTTDAKTKTYGGADPSFTGSNNLTAYDASLVSYAYAPQSYSGNAGSYVIGATATDASSRLGNYNITNNYHNLTVNQAALTITANNKTKTYGTANPAYDATISGLTNGDTTTAITGLVLNGPAANSNVGSYNITGSGAANANYAISYVNGQLTINPAYLTVTATAGQSRTYGAADPGSYSYTYSGLVNGDTAALFSGALSRDAGSNAGSYAINRNGLDAIGNYRVNTYNGNNFIINPALLSVTANSGQHKTYGDANPSSYSYGYTGLVNGDTNASFSGALTRAVGENAGNYTIGIGNLATLGNYTIGSYSGSNFAIDKANLLISANNSSSIYGSNPQNITLGYTGFVNSENQSVLTSGPVITVRNNMSNPVTLANNSNAGTYSIGLSGAAAQNYNITYGSGNYVINKAMLTVSASPVTIIPGQNPNFTATYSGYVLDHDQSILSSTASFSNNAPDYTTSGAYNVTPYGVTVSNPNYDIAYNSNLFIIGPPLPSTVVFVSQTPAFTQPYQSYPENDQTSAGAEILFPQSNSQGLEDANTESSSQIINQTPRYISSNRDNQNTNITILKDLVDVTPKLAEEFNL